MIPEEQPIETPGINQAPEPTTEELLAKSKEVRDQEPGLDALIDVKAPPKVIRKKDKPTKIKTPIFGKDQDPAMVEYNELPLIHRFYYERIKYSNLVTPLILTAFLLLFGVGWLYRANSNVIVLMAIFGSIGFAPIGFLLGWFVMDPFMRATIFRKLTHRNFGILFLVSRGKQIIPIIKDLNGSLIWHDRKVWVVAPNRIYTFRKSVDGDHPIKSKDVYLFGGVPTMFLDFDTMKPIGFFKDQSEIKPEELGASLIGWNNNQIAKAIVFKKQVQTIITVLLMIIIACAYFSYQNYTVLQNFAQTGTLARVITQ